jgi:uncharacterized protein
MERVVAARRAVVEESSRWQLGKADPVEPALIQAIRTGDLTALRGLLAGQPGLAAAGIQIAGSRTPLHLVSDWPGCFPNGPETVRMLVAAGADASAPGGGGPQDETPLHWAASSDDVEVAAALIDAGADIEAPGSSIAGGSPLENAVGYGCWHVARLLVESGARVDRLWLAAALGLLPRVEELLTGIPAPTAEDITEAFWQACHGGQRRMAEYLLAKGADINGNPGYTDQSPLDAAGSVDTRRDTMIAWLRDQGARSAKGDSTGS